MKRRWRVVLGVGLLLLVSAWILGPWVYWWMVGLFYGVNPPPQPGNLPTINYPVAEVTKDTRPVFRIDPNKAYRIELGGSSGWHGLNSVKISQDGTVVLHCHQGTWYTATRQLSEQTLAQVLQAVEDNHLLGMDRAYHANVADGTQWVLWIKQGDNEKSIYFNNHFPKEIIRFAESLDKAFADGKLAWHPIAPWKERDHEKELWDSIKR